MQRFLVRNKALLSFVIAVFFSGTTVFAGNPGAPILPSDNIQDPGALSTPWGGCGPSDSNCYVTTPTGGTASLSSLTAATVNNTINNANYTQEWQWNSLSGSGLKITSNSTAASGNAQKLFEVALSGANALAGQTTYAGIFSNTHTGAGTNIGLSVSVSGGADNYAALFNGGVVGIGTTTPDTSFALDVNGTTHLNNRLYIGPLPENYSPAFINVSSFATKNTFVNSVFSLSSTETGSPTYPTQLIFAQEGATVGWSLSSVNQGVAYTPIILSPYGGKVLIGTKVNNDQGALQVEGNVVPSIDASYSLGTGSYQWGDVYATYINGIHRDNFVINGGNTLGTAVSIGTNDTNTLSFRTDSTDRVIIDDLGNVGIGDTTPASLFTVGSGDLFQVNSSGAIAAATGITSSGTITFSGISGSTQCLQVNSSGVVSGTGSACGSGGAPSLTSTRIAFGDGSNLMTSSSKLVFNDNLYPTLVITGNDPLIYIGPSGTLTNNPAFGSGSGAAIYGGATYKSINFYDQISGGAMLARFYSGSGTLYNELKGLVTASTLSIPSNYQGAFTIQRTYPYAVTGNNAHGYTDQTIFQTGAAAFNSFGSFVEFGNSASSQDHYAAFQNVWKKSGTNNMSKVYGFVNAVSEITGGTITDLYGYYHYSPTMTSGTITNQYAVYVPAVTGGNK